jgi:hypothetical protein
LGVTGDGDVTPSVTLAFDLLKELEGLATTFVEEIGYDLLLLPEEEAQEVIGKAVAVRGILKFLQTLPSANVEVDNVRGEYCRLSGLDKLKSEMNVANPYIDRLMKLNDCDFKWFVNYFRPDIDIDAALSIRNLRLSYAMLLQSD